MMFKYYFILSWAITGWAVYDSYRLHQQFYTTVLYLSTNKLNRTILMNFVLMVLSTIVLNFIKLIFGELTEIERISVSDKTKRKILEVGYLTIFFYEELDWLFIVYLMALMALSVPSWITRKRASYLIAESKLGPHLHFRVLTSFIILFYVDFQFAQYLHGAVDQNKIQDVYFLYEFIMLPVKLTLPFLRYTVTLFEIFTYSHFESKSTIFSILRFFFSICKFVLQISIIDRIYRTRGLFIYLLIDGIESVVRIVRQFKLLINQFRLINLINKIEDVSHVSEQEVFCLICLHHLDRGKKLTCGHIFHVSCIKTWIQENPNQFCPTCKRPIQLAQQSVEANSTQAFELKKQIYLQELQEIKNRIELLTITQKHRQLQQHQIPADGIGAVKFGLPVEAVRVATPITEIRRLQINQMNLTLLGLDSGAFQTN